MNFGGKRKADIPIHKVFKDVQSVPLNISQEDYNKIKG